MSEERAGTSRNRYVIYAERNDSQFEPDVQAIPCRILEAHRDHLLVDHLKRYGKKYAGASKAKSGPYKGMAVRRINRDQVLRIKERDTGKILQYETVRRREGTRKSPGRSRGGK